MYSVAKGLTYMHSKNITHYDIKPGNILLAGPDLTPKICDFGMGSLRGDKVKGYTPNYCSLE